MVKSYVSLTSLEDPRRLDKSLDFLLDLGIDGLHLDVMRTTPKGTASPFLPECVSAIADYARSKQRYDAFKVDVHLLVPMQHLAVRNYKRKGISGIVLDSGSFQDNPKRFVRSLFDIRNDAPKMRSGASYSLTGISAEQAFIKDLDYVVYTVSGTDGLDNISLYRLKEFISMKKGTNQHTDVGTNPLMDIMVEGRLKADDVRVLSTLGVDAVILKYDNVQEYVPVLKSLRA